MVDAGCDLGNELHRARRAADHGDALAGEVVVVVPARRVEHGAGELVESRDLGPGRIAEHPDRSDDDVELVFLAVLGGEAPHRTLVVPSRRGDAVAEAEVRSQPVLRDAVLEVGVDLGLRSVWA